jgi:threonine dehydrogenase-like Zn-dependent dehydrogenase
VAQKQRCNVLQRYWEGVLELIQKGDLDPTWLITTKGSLADAPQLYREFYEQKTGIVKVFLRP